MKQPDFAKWYFYQLLKDYEGEQLYLNELGYVYGNEEKTNEIVKNNPGYVVKIFEEKMVNELKIRTRMTTFKDLRIAIEKYGWNN